MEDRVPDTDKGIICPVHNKQGLSNSQYRAQMARPNNLWHCPIVGCSEPVQWDDDRYEADALTDPDDTPRVTLTSGHEGREMVYKQAIKTMIDKQGVSGLLDLIGEVCRAKEEAETDDKFGRSWWAAAVHIEHASNLITLSGL